MGRKGAVAAGLALAVAVAATAAPSWASSLSVAHRRLVPIVNANVPGKGITSRQIKVGFDFFLSPCGSNPATASYGVATNEYKSVLAREVKWFNTHVQFPDGRHIAYSLVDDAGSQPGCATKAAHDALVAATKNKDFAVLGTPSLFNGTPVFAQTLAQNGTIAIGGNFQTTAGITSRWPFVFSTYQPGQQWLTYLGWFIIKREIHIPYVAPNGAHVKRKFAGIFFDDPLDRQLAADLEHQLAAAHIAFSPYFVSTNQTTGATQAAQVATTLKAQGVNSVVFAVYGAPGIADAKAFDADAFFPTELISDYGAFTSLAVFDFLYGDQYERFIGVGIPDVHDLRVNVLKNGDPGPSEFLQHNTDNVTPTIAYEQAGGKLASPSNGAPLADIWAELATLAVGVQNAGPTLNAKTFAAGLRASDTVSDRAGSFGSPQSQSSIIYWTRSQPWDEHGFTTVYYTQKPNTYDSSGYFESYDGYTTFNSYAALPARPTYNTGLRKSPGGQGYPYHPQAQSGGISLDSPCPPAAS